MWRQIARILRLSAVYGAGNVASAVLAFFLLPLYTHRLSPAEFGIYSLTMMVYSALTIIADFGLTNSIARYYYEESHASDPSRLRQYRHGLISTAVATTAVLAIAIAAALCATSNVIGVHLLGSGVYGPLLRIVAVLLLFRGLTTAPMVYLRVTERAAIYAALTVLQMSLFVVGNILFVIVLRLGVEGVLYSQLFSTVFWAIFALASIRFDLVVAPSWRIARELFRFGLPFLPALVFTWIIDLSDRYLLGLYTTEAQVGLYSLGYRLGQLMTFVVTAFTLGWGPIRFKLLAQKNAPAIYGRIATFYVAGAGFVWLILTVFARPAVQLLSPARFHDAHVFVGPVALGYFLNGLFVLAVTGMGVTKRTSSLPWVSFAAAVVNVGLNIVLIPRVGPIAAAYTTVLAYLLMTTVSFWISQRLYPIPYEYARWLALGACMVGLAMLERRLPHTALSWTGLGGRVGLLMAYTVVLAFAGILRRSEWRELRARLRAAFPLRASLAVPNSQPVDEYSTHDME